MSQSASDADVSVATLPAPTPPGETIYLQVAFFFSNDLFLRLINLNLSPVIIM